MERSAKSISIAIFFAPIISLGILTIGNGFFVTLTTIQLKNLNTSDWLIGLISAGYFAGIMVASYRAQRFIIRVGHIRAYAAFASLMAVCSLVQGLIDSNIVWFFARYICGYSLAGLIIVIESWCLEGSSIDIKGKIFSFYLFSYYLALALGQLFLRINYHSMLIPFCIIAGTASLSILPVAITRFEAPKLSLPESFSPKKYCREVPLGVLGSLIAGLILSGIYTILPLVFKDIGFTVSKIAYLMGITILGGTIFQIPVGKISDLFDRRLILLAIAACCFFISMLLILIARNFLPTAFLMFLLGGAAFVIYPLSISHATDYTKQKDTIAVISTLSLAYGIGSTVGPIIIANIIRWLGANFIFYFFAANCLLLFIYSIWRIIKREKSPEKTTVTFVPVAQEIIIGAEQTVDKNLNQ